MFGPDYKRVRYSGRALLGLEGQMVGKVWGQDYVTVTLNAIGTQAV